MRKVKSLRMVLGVLIFVLVACNGPIEPTAPVSPVPTAPVSPVAIPVVGEVVGRSFYEEEGEVMDFSDAVVNGVPLLVIIIGLVEFAKKFGLTGEACTALSLALGLVLGMLYQLQSGIPAGLAGWFGVVMYGLGMGLVASGLYKAVLSPLKKK